MAAQALCWRAATFSMQVFTAARTAKSYVGAVVNASISRHDPDRQLYDLWRTVAINQVRDQDQCSGGDLYRFRQRALRSIKV